MATYQSAAAGADRLQAVHENSKAVNRTGRLAALGRGIAEAVSALVRETGRLLKVAIIAGILGGAAGFGLVMLGYPDPVVGLKHFASAPHCAIAEKFGLENARYGRPGYWKHHDPDRNGVSCEM